MFVWYFLMIVLLVLKAVFPYCRSENKKQIFLFVFFGMCALILGLKGLQVGRDTQEYCNIFYDAAKWDFGYILSDDYNQKIEVGYAFIMKLSSIIWNNYFFFQFWTSCLFCYFIAKFIYDNTDDLFMASVIFMGSGIFLQAFTVTRQYLAVSIVINAWTMLKRKKYLKSLAFFVGALLIHNTSIVFGLVFILYILRNKKKFLSFIPIVSICAVLNYQNIFTIVKMYFPQYSPYFNNEIAKISAGGSMIMWFIVGFVALIMLLNKQTNTYLRIEALLCVMYSLLSFAGLFINYMDRLAYFFIPFLVIVLPEFKNEIKGIRQKCEERLLPFLARMFPVFSNKVKKNCVMNVNVDSIVSRVYCFGVIICYLLFYIMSIRAPYLQYCLFWVE